VTVSAAVFPKRKQNLMQTRSFKSAIEKSTKTMTEAQEKNHPDAIDLSSRTPLGQLIRRAVTYTHQAGADGSNAPLHYRKKKFSLFLGPPSYVFTGSKADVFVFKFHVTVRFFSHAIPNIKHQNCIATAALLTSTKFKSSTITAEFFSPAVYSKAVNLPLFYAVLQTTLTRRTNGLRLRIFRAVKFSFSCK